MPSTKIRESELSFIRVKVNITHLSRYHLGITHCDSSPRISTLNKHTTCVARHLEDAGEETLPRGPLLHLLALAVDEVPVEFATAGVNIHLGSPEPSSALPEVTTDPESNNDEQSEVGLEEVLGCADALADGRDSGVKLVNVSVWKHIIMKCDRTYLSHQDDDDDTKTNPGSDKATGSLEWDLINGVTVVSPGLTEADMSQANGTPSEQGSKTGQRDKPVEDDLTGRGNVHVCKGTPQKNEKDGEQRATGTIHVGESLGSIALLREGGEGTGATVDTGDTDRNDRDENDDVHEAVETGETTITTDDDEGRGIGATLTEKIRVVRANQKTDKGETEDVEEGDTPEDLTDGTRERLERVLCLSSGETDKLSTGEGEGSCDEDCAETLETVPEGTGVVPETGAPVFVVDTPVRTSTEDEDQGNDHEDDGGGQLEARGPELFLGISQRSENVDEDDKQPEDEHPNTDVDGCSTWPVTNCEGSDVDFKR